MEITENELFVCIYALHNLEKTLAEDKKPQVQRIREKLDNLYFQK